MRRIATGTAIVAAGLLTGLLLGNYAYPELKRAPDPEWMGGLRASDGQWADAAYAPPPPAYPAWTSATRPDLDYEALAGDVWSDLAVIEPPADFFAPDYFAPAFGSEDAGARPEALPPPDLAVFHAAAEQAADAALATVADAAEAAQAPAR